MFGGGGSTHTIETRLTASGGGEVASEFAQAASASRGFKAATVGLGGAMAAAAAGGIAKATQAAMDFESQMAEVQKVTSAAAADELSGKIQEMAREIPLTTQELASLTEQAGRFGIEGPQNIESFTRSVAKMATATDLGASEAGKAFAKLATLTETPVPKVENLGSSINELSNNAAASSSEITRTMLKASGALTQLGMSTTDIVALSGAMNEVSASARRAGTGLRRVAQELKNPKKVEKFANALGMNTAEFKNMRKNDPTGLFKLMAKEMANNTQKGEALRKVLSTASRKTLNKLGQNLDGVNSALKTSSQSFEDATSLQREFEIQANTTANQLQLLKNSLTVAAQQTGSVFLPAVASLLGVVKGAVDRFTDFNAALNGVPGAIGLVTAGLAGLTAAFTALSGTLVATGVAAFGSALMALLAPITAVGAAIAGLAAAWDRDFANIQTATKALTSLISNQFGSTLRFAFETGKMVIEDFRAAFGGMSTGVESRAAGLVSTLRGYLTNQIVGIFSRVRGALQSFAEYWRANGDQIIATVRQKFGTVRSVVTGIVRGLAGAVKAVLTGVTQAWNRHGARLTAAARGAYNAAKATVLSVIQAIRPRVESFLNAITQAWRTHGTDVRSAVRTPYQAVVNFITNTVSGVLTTVTAVLERATQAWRSHGSNASGAVNTVSASIAPYKAAIVALGGVLATWAVKTGRVTQALSALTSGVTSGALPAAKSIGAFVASTLAPAFGTKLVGALRSAGTGIGTLTTKTQAGQTAANKLGTAATTLRGYVTKLGNKARAAGQIFKNVLLVGLTTARNMVTRFVPKVGTLRGVISKLAGPIKSVAGFITNRLVGSFATTIARIGPLVTKFGSLGSAIGLLTNPIGLVVAAIAGLWVAWQTNLGNIQGKTETVLSAVKAAFNGNLGQIKTVVKNTLASIETFWNTKLKPLVPTTEQIINGIVETFRSAKQTFKQVVNAIGQAVNLAWQTEGQKWASTIELAKTTIINVFKALKSTALAIVQPFLQRLTTFWQNNKEEIIIVVGALVTAVSASFRTLANVVLTVVNEIAKFLQRHQDKVRAVSAFVSDTLLSVLGAAFDTLATIVKTAIDLMNGNWERGLNRMINLGKRILNGIVSFVSKWGGKLVRFIADALSNAVQKFVEWGKQLIFGSIVKDIFNAIVEFISNWASRLVSAVKGAVDQAKQAAINAFNALRTKVVNAAQRVRELVVNAFNTLRQRAVNVFNTIRQKLSNAANKIKAKVSQAFQKLKDLIRTAIENARQRAVSAFNTLKEKISTAATRTKELVLTAFQTLKERAVTAFENIRTRLENAANTIKEKVTTALQTLKENVVTAVQTAKEKAVTAYQTAKEKVVTAVQTLKETATTAIQTLKENVVTAAQTAKEKAVTAFQTAKETIITAAQTAKERVSQAFSKLRELVAKAMKTLKERLIKIYDAIKRRLKKIADETRNLVLRKFKKLKRQVKEQMKKLKKKAVNALNGLKDNLKSKVEGAVDAAKKPFESFKDTVVGNSIIPETIAEVNDYLGKWDMESPLEKTMRDARKVTESEMAELAKVADKAPGVAAAAARGGGTVNVVEYNMSPTINAETREGGRKAADEFIDEFDSYMNSY